jgi:hypothetical protein
MHTDEIYIGSTYQALHKRMFEHRNTAKTGKRFRIYEKMRELGIDTFSIELVESYPCENRTELRQREGYWIRHLKATLNMITPGRTDEYYQEYKKEYNKQHKEQIKHHKHKFYEEHKDRIKERVEEYRANNIAAIKSMKQAYYEKNKDRLKQYREMNSDRIRQRKSEHNDCSICGGKYRTCHRAVHVRTLKHQKALEKQ